MNRLISLKSIVAAAAVLGGLGAASLAHARSDVQFSIGVNLPGVYAQPAPVYVQPRPYYVQPAPVYVQPAPVYAYPQPDYGWQRRGAWGDRDGDGIANIYDNRDDRFRHGHNRRPHGFYGDADRDGVPNGYDRFPANPYRR